MIAFVEATRGVVHTASYTESMDSRKFLGYCKDVSLKMKGEPFTLFLDGASFHRSKDIAEDLESLGISRVINVPYSPQYNPIEGCFSIVKNYFKRKRLHDIVNGNTTLLQRLIYQSFQQVAPKRVQAMIRSSHGKLFSIWARYSAAV